MSGSRRRTGNHGGSRGGQPSSGRGNNNNPASFWGNPGNAEPEEPPVAVKVRPTGDPAAVPRSLGDAPLGASPAVVAHHLAVVYEEAVKAATALAAANGLLEDAPWLGDADTVAVTAAED